MTGLSGVTSRTDGRLARPGFGDADRAAENGFRFFFFANEGSEPPHIHVARGDCVAKFWLLPILLDYADDCTAPEVARAEAIVTDHVGHLLERWHEFFDA